VSYCINPSCATPENTIQDSVCRNCGTPLMLRDRYRASRPLGKGGFGATFLAADMGLPGHPPCVIKQLRPNTQSSSVMRMARELFEREAFTLGKIGNHPQIPRLLDYFEEGGNFYLVQEYVEGETLKQELERRGKFNEIEIRKIMSELLTALGFIHENGVIHRDIKPANIIRRKQDGQLVLIDFGAVSTQVNRSPSNNEEDPADMLTNFAIGTPGFAPPEQMAMRPVFSSDLYAMTMCCLYLMTGRSPKDFAHDQYTGQIDWRSQISLSSDLAVVVDRLLEQSTTARYRTAAEVIEALSNRSTEPKTSARSYGSQDAQVSQRMGIQSTVQSIPDKVDLPQRAGRYHVTGLQGQGQVTTDQTRGKELKGGRKIIAEYNHGKRNFANQDHSKASLAGANLTGIVMSRSRLAEADLCQANLTNASFQGAIMTSAKLNGANLRGAKLFRTILNKADLGGACLDQADLKEANLQGAYLSKADLSGADLSSANLKGAYFKQANLRGANLCGADLTGAQISSEQLASAKTNWSTIRPDGGKRLF
jgi:serine/threonine protein kinase, bacterial